MNCRIFLAWSAASLLWGGLVLGWAAAAEVDSRRAAGDGRPSLKVDRSTPATVSTNLPRMSTPIPPGYEYQVVAPTNHAGLTCRFLKPTEFKLADLPPAEVDFSKGSQFMPLAIALTQYGPMIFSLAARPAFDDGAVSQWLEYICREENYPHGPVTETRIGDLPAVTCDATQKTDEVTMKMRFVLFEDGGRLFQMAAMAPEPLWSAAIQKLEPMLASLELRERRGTKIPLRPGQPAPVLTNQPPAAPAVAAATPSASAESAPTTKPSANASTNAPTPPAPVAATASTNAAPTAILKPEEMIALALADDMKSLDPEHPMNANLRNRGVGMVPRVVSTNAAMKCVKLAAGSLQGFLRVPLGWHVIDDGKRTLVFDAEGKIQISLSQRLREKETTQEYARALLKDHLERQPDLPVAELYVDGVAGAGVRGVAIENEVLDQCFFVRDIGRPGLFLVARATASSADSVRALDLAGDIVATFEVPATAP